MAINFRSKKDTGPRTNEKITASEVRVISSTGKQLGIISIREALNHAEDEGFDLVEVSPEASPPVCKIIDYGKLKYREQKSKKEAKKKQKTIEVL
nr:translation initiation factor IF-3 [Pelagibacterales bacterium]